MPWRVRVRTHRVHPQPSSAWMQADRAVLVGAHDGRHAPARARRASTVPGGRRCCRCRPRSRRAGAERWSSAGSPGRRCRGGRPSGRRPARGRAAGDVALGVGGEQHRDPRRLRRVTSALSFGLPPARSRRARRRPQDREAQGADVIVSPAAGAWSAGAARGQRALDGASPSRRRRRRPAAGGTRRSPRRGALVVGLGVGEHQRVEPLDAGLLEAPRIGPSGGPVSTSTRRRRAGSASRRPGRRRGTRRAARRAAGGAARRAARRDRPPCRGGERDRRAPSRRASTPPGRWPHRRSASATAPDQRRPGGEDHGRAGWTSIVETGGPP